MLFALVPVLHRQFPHYYLPALPFAALLAAVFWDSVARRLWRGWLRLVFAGLALAGLAWPILWLWEAGADLARGATVFDNLRAGHELRALLGGRPVLILGVEPEYYFLCGADPPTPHLYLYDENLRLEEPGSTLGDLALLKKKVSELAARRDYRVLVRFDYWDWWPEEDEENWEQIGSTRVWMYDTRCYNPVEVRVLVRRDDAAR
jgi:hypothetical protein